MTADAGAMLAPQAFSTSLQQAFILYSKAPTQMGTL